MKKIVSIVLNNFKNDSRVLKENISLIRNNYDVKVVALYDDLLEEFELIQTIPVHRIKLKTRTWSKHKIIQIIKYFEFIYKFVKLYKNNDIFHCNDLNTLPIGVIIKIFFNKNAKIIYDAHEYEINVTPNESQRSIKLKYFLEKFLIKYANKVITVSDSIANEYSKMYNIRKPELVLNTPSYKEIKKKNIFRETLGISEQQIIFLYQGGLSEGRGIEILIESFKLVDYNNAVIVFMGYGPLESLIKEATNKFKNIYFHDAVSPEVLLDFTCSADFGILFYENNCLNHEFCSPNKVFEYIMAEIPVIVSNLYEMKRLVEFNKIGIVSKENTINGLKEAVDKAMVLDKKELISNIQELKKIYNWEEQEKVLLNVYKELI